MTVDKVLGRLFGAAALVWALALSLAPFTATLDGLPRRLTALVYLTGSVVCHQKPERSFLSPRQWPVCARCAGIYLAAGASVLFIASRPRPHARVGRVSPSVALAWAVVPSAVTLAWEWTVGAAPSNIVRAAAGVPIGLVVAWIVMRRPRPARQSG